MREFCLGQLDYIFFVYALAFFLLFAICISLPKQREARIPWYWLGLFGLIHGGNEWLDMLALNLMDNEAFKWVRFICMTVSFVCLLEFGRATCERMNNSVKIGRWIYFPLFVAVFVCAQAGLPGMNAAARYAFGFPGGILAAFALWKIAGENREGARAMRAAAIAMAAYAMATGLVVPRAGVLFAAIINNDSFLNGLGFPVQLLRGFLAFFITAAIWTYHEELRALKIDPQVIRYEKRVAAGFVLVLVLLLGLGGIVTNQAEQSEAASQRNKLLRYSQQIAETVDPELVKGLTGTASDAGDSTYQTLKAQLQHLHNAMTSVRFIYLMRKVGEKIVFLADSEPSGSKDESPPGQVYGEASQKIREVFTSGKGSVDMLVTDRRGSWFSAYNPLNDRRTGEMVAVLGVDQDAREIKVAIGFARFKAIVLVGIACLAALLAFVYWQGFMHALKAGREGQKMDFLVEWGGAVVVLLLGATLTASLFLEFRRSSWDAFQTIFLQRAISRSQNIVQELERQIDRLDGLRRLLDSQEFSDRSTFNRYVSPLLKGSPIRAIEWAPRVARADRVFYESSARQDGLEGFQFYEKDPKGKKVPILERAEYFPVYYLEPQEGNEAAFGFDLASEAIRRTAMEKCRDMGQPVATPPITLVQEGKKKTGVLLFMPVYAKELPRYTAEQRRKSLKGFVLAVYNADDFLKGVYTRTPQEGLSCLIEDLEAAAEDRVLYRHVPRLGTVDWGHPLLKYEMPLGMPDRQWQMTIVPTTVFIERNLSGAYWWILLIGLILTVLLAAFLNFLVTARYRAERLVWQRTEELNSEKEALRRKEEDFHLLLDSMAEAIYGIDLNGLCTFCNPSLLRMLGYSDFGELKGKNMHWQIHHSHPDGTRFPVEECRIFQAFQKGEGTHVDDEVLWRADGSSFPAEYWSFPQRRGGKVVGAVVTFVDITERKKVEEALQKSEEEFRLILNSVAEAIYGIDLDGKCVFCNPACLQTLGYTDPSELLGKNMHYQIHHSNLDGSPIPFDECQLSQLAQKGEKVRIEEALWRADGSYFYAEVWAHPKLQDGKTVGAVISFLDITERKKNEDALRASEERYKQIAASITDYIYTVRVNKGKVVDTIHGPGCIGVTGYSAEEFSSQTLLWISMVPEEDRPKLLEQGRLALSGKKPEAIEHRIIKKDGSLRWVSSRVILRFGLEGDLIAYEGVIGDITERKQAELRLQQSFEALKTLLERMPFGVILIGKDKKIRQVNSAALKMIGAASAEDVLQKKCNDCICPAHPGECPVMDLGEMVERAEKELIRCDGSRIPVLKTVLPITLAEEEVLLETFVDITELKRIENDLEEARRQAEAANKAKSQFLANMSHEIRTPMNAVIGYSELLESTVLNAVQKGYVTTIRDSGQMLMLLISDILDVSKIEAGEMKLEEVDFDLMALLKSVIKMNSFRLGRKHIEMFFNVDEKMPAGFRGDPTRIRQILTNLIGNAIKFTEKGEISISVRSVETSPASAGGRRMLHFSVKDTGIGIPKDKHERIFQAFEQADTSTTRKYGGTGLGLTISKTLVEIMGGKIWVESTPGLGSEFHFTLDLAEAVLVKQEEDTFSGMTDLKDRKVLIVEDNESASAMFDIYCRDAGMVVLHRAATAQDALDWLAGCPELPEVILSDIMMPGMDGYELARRIRNNEKARAIKLVAVTSDIRAGASQAADEAGFDAFLPKPILRADLFQIVQAVLVGHRRGFQTDQLEMHPKEEGFALKGLKVLIVEDNLINQELLQVQLKGMGCDVDVASNGQVAVEKVRATRFDLVLMDMQMPIMGGCEATEMIRGLISKTLPILALTAAVMKKDEQRSLEAGMNDFITKPVELVQLKKKILQWTARSQP